MKTTLPKDYTKATVTIKTSTAKFETTLLLEGEETEALITQCAEEKACDLIAMGAYGESRIREWLLGSTTSGVLVRATHPVLLAR